MAARSKQAIAEIARDAQLALRIEDARRTLYSLMECPRGRRALADFDSAARRLIDEVRIQNGTEQLRPIPDDPWGRPTMRVAPPVPPPPPAPGSTPAF